MPYIVFALLGLAALATFTCAVLAAALSRASRQLEVRTSQNDFSGEMSAIAGSLAELRGTLQERQADPQHLKTIEHMLSYAHSKRIEDLQDQLRRDQDLFDRISGALRNLLGATVDKEDIAERLADSGTALSDCEKKLADAEGKLTQALDQVHALRNGVLRVGELVSSHVEARGSF